MTLSGLDNEFLFALRTPGQKRNERELDVIYSRLYSLDTLSSFRKQDLRALCPLVRFESHNSNEILFRKDDACRCWYILLSGAVFIQGTMFLPFACFGRQIPGTKRRGSQCLILEPSAMLAIDYPDMAVHTGGIATRPHALRHTTNNMTTSSSQGTLDSVAEVETSSSEGSPMHQSRSNSLTKSSYSQSLMTNDFESQSSLSKDLDEDDFTEQDLDEEDSISLHSTSSFQIKDHVIEVLKKDANERNADDLEILMEFTKSLQAFSNMTEPIRRALCNVMVFAWVDKANTTVLKDDELLDSWSVIINGQVLVKSKDDEVILAMGDSFGVQATLQPQHHKGVMTTTCDDCQFLCIAQQEYYEVLHQGQENIENVYNESGDLVMVKEKREFESGTRRGNIVIRGTADSLLQHMLDENTIDVTYPEDFLLTYRAFCDEPLKICGKLLEWFENLMFRDKVIRIILLWVNNHFNDFECDWKMMDLLEKFEEKLHKNRLVGEMKLFNIACTAKAKPRIVTVTRASCDVELGFGMQGGSEHRFPIYISSVTPGSSAEAQGVKRGDQLLEVNGQNFEKLSFEKAMSIIQKNTELTMTLKTNLFAFKEMVAELKNPTKKKYKTLDKGSQSLRATRLPSTLSMSSMDSEMFDSKPKKGGTLGRATRRFSRLFKKDTTFNDFMTRHGMDSQGPMDDTFLPVPSGHSLVGSFATLDGTSRPIRQTSSISVSNPDLLEPGPLDYLSLSEVPEDVIKIYNAEQSVRFLFVNKDTTAGDAVQTACLEFGLADDVSDYALYRVSVQGEKFVKQSKLPDPWSKLADIPLGARYYLKNTMNSEQLLPDENIPDLLKEANFSFLDLNCFEIALYLTREDYEMFQLTEPSNFIDDLFRRVGDLQKFKDFEDLVNRELFWVVTTICSEQNALQRSKIIKHFIKIAQHCKILKNFNSTFALISGLGYRAVSRLKQTWEKVPAKNIRQFDELQALMDPSRNMSKYRTLLNDHIHQPPVIPYVPVVKKDLTFLHLGNDTKVDGLINFEKMRMIAKEVRNIARLCAPDKSQIIPSAAAAQQKESEKGAIYQTLARRGRRSSFNNARRMYEDQMNVRRAKQYMQQMKIVSDEDELMEMSKLVEPAASTNATGKRRPGANNFIDSPSRTSKTLPNQLSKGSGSNGSNSSLHSRNNSDPHLAGIPTINVEQGSRKKTPSSTLPKYSYDLNSPQMISRKLMSLSEESGDQKGRLKRVKDGKRSSSVSSHEYSPASSPYPTPKHQNAAKSNTENNHTVASENVNRNNNRYSLPAGTGHGSVSDHVTSVANLISQSKRFSTNNSSASSCRSSITSTSSLGTMSSSNPSTSSLTGSGSPHSGSPVSWETNSSVSATSIGPLRQKLSESPVRSSSSSSADTVKSVGSKHTYHERPVIKQTRNGRSSSYGGGNIMLGGMNDRRLSQISASSSSSSPTLNVTQPLILPNHPRIPRTPSMDSGVVSAGSLSADSARFSVADESELFSRVHPQARSHQRPPSYEKPHRSQAPGDSASHPQSQDHHDQNEKDKVKKTFLSGYRGQGDPPRPVNKDPLNLPLVSPSFSVDRGKFINGSVPFQGYMYPPGMVQSPTRPPAVRSMIGKGGVKGIQEFLICERHAAMHNHYYRTNFNNCNNNPLMQPNYIKVMRTTTPEAALEEQLVQQLQKQKADVFHPRRRHIPTHTNTANMADLERLSLSGSDPSLSNHTEWPMHHVPARAGMGSPSNSSSPKPHHYVIGQKSLDEMTRSDISCVSASNSSYGPVPPDSSSYHLQYASQSPVQGTQFVPSIVGMPPHHHPSSETVQRLQESHEAKRGHQNHQEQNMREMCPPRSLNLPDLSRIKRTAGPMSPADCLSPRGHILNSPAYSNSSEIFEQSFYSSHVSYDVSDGSSSVHSVSANSYHRYESQSYSSPPERHRNLVDLPPGPDVQKQVYQPPSSEQCDHQQLRRKTSQEWNEVDLDVDKKQQTIKAWGSSTSLSSTSLSTKYTSGHPTLPPNSIQPNLLHEKPPIHSESKKGGNKPPPPPPPQRTTSIGRTRKLRESTSSPSASPPPHSSESRNGEENFHFHQLSSHQIANGHIPNHYTNCQNPLSSQRNLINHGRSSLPTYTEAIHLLNTKQKSLFNSSLNTPYTHFNTDARESSEQVSKV